MRTAILRHALLASVAACASASPASAQAERAAVDPIVVTGTRLDARDVVDNPVPVLVLDRQDLVAAPGTLAEALQIQPQVVPGGGPAAGGGSDGGQNFLDLRGLGNDRTLVLLDGRRFIPSGPNGFTDVYLIPEALVSQVNVVTGGASAAYGADAVAGVVDFRLDTAFTGLRVNGYSGISQRGDNAERKVTAAAGFGAIEERLHVVVSAEHYDNAGVPGDRRAFRRTAPGQIQHEGDGPDLRMASDVRTPYTPGGLVVIGRGSDRAANEAISGLMFEPDGTLSPYDYGRFGTTRLSTNGLQDGGDGFRASTGQDVIRPQERSLAFAHASYAVSDALTLDLEASRARSDSTFSNSPNRDKLRIGRDNPFLAEKAPELVGRMDALGVTGFTLNRMILERGPTLSRFRFKAGHELVGARLSALGLEWRATYQHARNAVLNTVANNLIPENLDRAIDVVAGPDGTPVCADTLSADPDTRAAAAGCAPFDPFGFGAPSQAALSYVTGTAVARGVTTMHSFDGQVTGRFAGLGAEPVAFAAGVNWRELKSRITADQRSTQGGWRVRNQQDFSGRTTVREAFAEIRAPLVRDRAIAHSLDLNLAARVIDYANSGVVWTWKAGLNWRPSRSLRLRATRSRDIRAPSLEELFATGRQGKATIADSLTGQTYSDVPVLNLGNSTLRPEKADTWVVGVDFEPTPRFRASLDYWSIDIAGAIREIAAAQTVEQCNLSNQTLPICSWIVRDPVTRAILQARVSPVNLSSQRARGMDFQLNWQPQKDWLGLGDEDDASLRMIASYAIRNQARSPLIADSVDDAGNLIAQSAPSGSRIASLPRLRVNTALNVRRGPWEVYLLGRYIHSFTWDKTRTLGIDTDFNRIPAQFYVDSEFSVHPRVGSKEVELYLNVQNLLDHQPPYSPVPGNSTPLPSQPVLYDQVGRMLRVGIRLDF